MIREHSNKLLEISSSVLDANVPDSSMPLTAINFLKFFLQIDKVHDCFEEYEVSPSCFLPGIEPGPIAIISAFSTSETSQAVKKTDAD